MNSTASPVVPAVPVMETTPVVAVELNNQNSDSYEIILAQAAPSNPSRQATTTLVQPTTQLVQQIIPPTLVQQQTAVLAGGGQPMYGSVLDTSLTPTAQAQSLVALVSTDASDNQPALPAQLGSLQMAANVPASTSSSKNIFKGALNSIVGAVQDIFNPDQTTSSPRIEISNPYNPVHVTHVGYNSATGEFTGLPQEWKKMLEDAGITRQEQQAHPQAIMDIIGFYEEGLQKPKEKSPSQQKYMMKNRIVPPQAQVPMQPMEQLPKKPVESTQKRPPVPARPTHTLSMYSSDIKSPAASAAKSEKVDVAIEPVRPSPEKPPARKAPPPPVEKVIPQKPSTPIPGTPSASAPVGTLRRKKEGMSSDEVVEKLRNVTQIGVDPMLSWGKLVKIGQGASGGVYTARHVETDQLVAMKQMNLEAQPKKDLIINEILVMREMKQKNIVNYIDSYLWKGDLWVVMEYMEGGSLTDVVTSNYMTEPQMATVCRETLEGLRHLHNRGVIHRDIKSDNILLSLSGDVKLSTYLFMSLLMTCSGLWFLCSIGRKQGQTQHYGGHTGTFFCNNPI
jgi:hypothetical protein